MASSVTEYLQSIEASRQPIIQRLREIFINNLPKGFTETLSYGMIGYVVPQSLYPAGYHCDPKLPLPFINLASQKKYISIYHMGLYADAEMLKWFTDEYKTACGKKPDMGKSCIRFSKPDEIPFDLIKQLAAKMTVKQWITLYESALAKPNSSNKGKVAAKSKSTDTRKKKQNKKSKN